jgi:hypothetical protein
MQRRRIRESLFMFAFTEVDCLGWPKAHAVVPLVVYSVAGRGGGDDGATAAAAQ